MPEHFKMSDGYCAVKSKLCSIGCLEKFCGIGMLYACSECGPLETLSQRELHLFRVPMWLKQILERGEGKGMDIMTLRVDECPAGRAMDMAVAKARGLEQLHWGSTEGSWGNLGFMQQEKEGEAYCLWSECNEIAPISAYSSSDSAAFALWDDLCTHRCECHLDYSSLDSMLRISVAARWVPRGIVTAKANSRALVITRAYLKANGVTRIERGPRGF